MLTTLYLILTAVFLQQLYRPGPERSRQAGFLGALAKGGTAAAKAAAAAVKATAAAAAKAGTTVAKGAVKGAKVAGGAVKGVAGPAAKGVTGGTTGVLGGLLGKSEKQPSPPSVPSTGATTPSLIQGAGGKLLDSNKAAGGDTQAMLAQVVQQTIERLQSVPAKKKQDKEEPESRGSIIKQAAADVAVSQAVAGPTQQRQLPQIGTLAANTPVFAEGGVSPPGQPFIAGDAGGAPELITPAPDGSNVVEPITPQVVEALTGQQGTSRARQGVPTPVTQAPEQPAAQPTVAQPTTGQPTQQPAEFDPIGLLSKLGDLGQDAAIAMLLGNPALIINLQQNRAEQRRFLAGQVLENPSILTSSPEAAQAYESLFGEGSALQLLQQNAPGAAVRRQATALGVNLVPPGTLDADGKPAPGLAEQINKWSFDHDYDFRLGPTGLQLSRNAPSHVEISTAMSYAGWGTLTQSNIDSGIPYLEASQLAAKQITFDLSKENFVVPPEIRELARAELTADVDARHAAAMAAATKNIELIFEPQIRAAGARGREIGEAQGAAAAAAMTLDIVRPNGSVVKIPLSQAAEVLEREFSMGEAISGVPGAVDLGRTPSKETLSHAAMSGMDIIVDPSGSFISVPIGHSFGGKAVPAGEILAGPQAIAALDEALLVIDDVGQVPNLLDAFPSEAVWGRSRARGVGWVRSWIRNFTDSPELLLARGQLRQMGFRMARLLGSNSQLSDREREAAQATYQPLIDGTATREQVTFALRRLKELAIRGRESTARPGAAARAIVEKGKPGAKAGARAAPTAAPPQPESPPGSFILTRPDGSTVVATPSQ